MDRMDEFLYDNGLKGIYSLFKHIPNTRFIEIIIDSNKDTN